MTDIVVAQNLDHEIVVEAALGRLTLEAKVRLLTGADVWGIHAEPAVGLRRMVVSDGPSGVRGQVRDERYPSLNLPSATALAATWDPAVAYRYATAMASEAQSKGVDVILGPTINLHRSPLGGRHFEAYSEDPVLTGVIAEAFVRGVQDHGIGACPKHYIANDFETERFTASVEVSDRALRELYLAPFERVVREAGAWTIMSAYNAVRGVTMTENDLLRAPLCEEWGFDGVVISDWGAVRSLESAKARQDLVMGGPHGPWGEALVDAVRRGEVPQEAVDEKVRRILRLAARVGALEGAIPAPRRPVEVDGIAVAREVEARGIVLVRNEAGVLPLAAPASIAVSGQSAAIPRTQGGGSATVVPTYTVSPLQGLREAFPAAEISYALGAVVRDGVTPLPLETLTNPETGLPGVRVRFLSGLGDVVLEEERYATSLVWLDTAPQGDVARFELATVYRPTVSGPVELGVAAIGRCIVSVDGAVILDVNQVATGPDLISEQLAPPAQSTRVDLVAERSYLIEVGYTLGGPGQKPGLLSLTLGSRPVVEMEDALIAEAASEARRADVAVVVVGTNEKVESEGFDRSSLALPGRQDELVRAVAAANPHTIVVVNAGSPVLMPWREDVSAVLLTWFGGQEYGRALVDVLTGAAEPTGRLPSTWPATQEDVPVIDVVPVEGVVRYDEGIHIGYRAWQRAALTPAYPFGFGLGYTSWSYDVLRVDPLAEGGMSVAVEVSNVGARPGREVVQVYLSRTDSAVERPARWLAGFVVVEAEAGATATASVTIPARAFQHWDEAAACWASEPGEFTVIAARNADSTDMTATITRR